MNKFELFISKSTSDHPSKVEIAINFIWYHFTFVDNEGVTIKSINEYFRKAHLSEYNVTHIKNDLRKSKNIIKGIKKNSYKPTRSCTEELNKKFEFLITKSEEVITSNTILPDSLYNETRGYIKNLSKQINACYENNIFDGCSVLMRRLLEILLIHSYEKSGRINDIREDEGYKNLSFIINHLSSNKPFDLSKEVRNNIDDFRVLGNFAVHKIQFNCKRQDIDNIKLTYRLTIEELLYASGILK